jgi:3-dehydroquinate synthase
MNITSSIRNYTVDFPENSDFIDAFEKHGERCYAVDQNVWRIYGDNLLKKLDRSSVIVVPVNEELKSLTSVLELYDTLIQRSAKRNLTLISIGGGILQDITGFVASTLYRGINWIFVPTTLLAQADSCIGGKTSLNYKAFKNLLGTFYPPSQVFVHTPFLLTQEDIDFYSGLGEAVKLHIIGGLESAERIMKLLPAIHKREPQALMQCVRDSLAIKHAYISEDEFDTGKRNMLNFGHCFGHAIEAASDFTIPHGQAVVLGVLLANMIATQRSILSRELQQFLAERLLMPSLTVKVTKNCLDPSKVIEGMKKDKKRTGKGLALVMMDKNYRMSKVNDLTEEEARQALYAADGLLATGINSR